jgi:eukaryotic translation initiation factor 2C
MKDRSTDPPTDRDISVYDYFYEKYKIRLEYPYLPLVQTTRDGFFPMEVCVLKPNQKYMYKLNPVQVCNTIRPSPAS